MTRTELVFASAAFAAAGALPGDRIEHAAVAPPDALAPLAALPLDGRHAAGLRRDARRRLPARRARCRSSLSLSVRGFVAAGIPLGGSTDAPYGDARSRGRDARGGRSAARRTARRSARRGALARARARAVHQPGRRARCARRAASSPARPRICACSIAPGRQRAGSSRASTSSPRGVTGAWRGRPARRPARRSRPPRSDAQPNGDQSWTRGIKRPPGHGDTFGSMLIRPRRNRASAALRRLVRETRLSPDDLVLPLFVQEGENLRTPIAAMPGHARLSIDQLVKVAREAAGARHPRRGALPGAAGRAEGPARERLHQARRPASSARSAR